MSRRAWLVAGAVVLVLVLVGVGIAVAASGRNDTAGGASAPPTSSAPTTPTGGASEEPPVGVATSGPEAGDDASASPETSAPPEERPTAAPTAAPGDAPVASLRDVTVTVPNASFDPTTRSIEAAGIVDDLVETGGRCTLVATSAGARATATATARGDATATYCGTVSLSTSDLAPGTWTVVVEYLSATARGASAPAQVQVD